MVRFLLNCRCLKIRESLFPALDEAVFEGCMYTMALFWLSGNCCTTPVSCEGEMKRKHHFVFYACLLHKHHFFPVDLQPVRVASSQILESGNWTRIQNGRHEKSVCTNLKKKCLAIFFFKNVYCWEANRLEPRSGPTYVGPDLSYSVFASVQNTDTSVSRLNLVKKKMKWCCKKNWEQVASANHCGRYLNRFDTCRSMVLVIRNLIMKKEIISPLHMHNILSTFALD